MLIGKYLIEYEPKTEPFAFGLTNHKRCKQCNNYFCVLSLIKCALRKECCILYPIRCRWDDLWDVFYRLLALGTRMTTRHIIKYLCSFKTYLFCTTDLGIFCVQLYANWFYLNIVQSEFMLNIHRRSSVQYE